MSQNYSPGEDVVQERFGTVGRATAFRKSQMLTHLNPMMEQFIQSKEMMFIATADAKGSCDCSFRGGMVDSSVSWTIDDSSTRSIEAMA